MNREKMRFLLNERQLSIYKLSKLTSIDDGQLNRIISGKTVNPRIDTVKAIAKALEVDINEII